MRQGLLILALLLAWGAAPGASVDKPPGPGAIQISYDGRTFDAGYLEAFATVDLPVPSDVGRICVDLTLGTLVRANGTSWVSLGGGSVTLLGDVTGTNAATVAAKASTTWAQTGVITIALAADTNDWAPTGLSGASVIQVSGSSFYKVTGLTGGSAGRLLTIYNTGTTNGLRLVSQSASSSAANRFAFADSITITPGGAVTLIYDGVNSRWRCIGRDAAQTTGDQNLNFASEFMGYQAGPSGGALTGGGFGYATVFGYQAGKALTGPSYLTILGALAAASATSAQGIYIGYNCAPTLTLGTLTVIGNNACPNITSGFPQNSVIVGAGACGKAAFGYDVIIGDGAAQSQLGNSNSTGESVYIGYTAGAGNGSSTNNPSRNVFIGTTAGYKINGTSQTVGVGYAALDQLTTATARMTALGYQAGHTAVTGSDCIFLGWAAGDASASSATNRLVAGSNTSPIADVYIGKGETNASPAATVYHATGGSGSNIAGADLKLAGGIGTGTGAGGTIRLQVAAAGSTGSSANALADALTVAPTGTITASTGDVVIATVGKGLSIKGGTNAKIGTAVLVGGTVTVSTTAVTANSIILLTPQVAGGTLGNLSIGTVTAGTSFVINSSSGAETSTVGWVIIEKG